MDPYQVLGINKNATEEEIRAAYHELVKKYHPDKYQDNPLADLAQEKLQEVNEAYEMLMKPSTTTTSGYSGSSSSYGSYGGYGTSYGGATYGTGYESNYAESGSSDYYDIRSALDRNELGKAEQLLGARVRRDAEWYFLSGVYHYKRGYYDAALREVRQAINMAPNNQEYQNIYRKISGTGTIYKANSTNRGYSSPSCAECAMCYCLGNAFCC